jgi:hypothetical protein
VEIFNKILFETIDEEKKVLIFIDEANAMSPANLESLRLLTNMQDDRRNLFTIVLAGQLELARRLEHPKRANLLQRIGTFSRIDKIESEDLVRAYVQTRLKLAGGARNIFTDDAYGRLWEYSEQGVPRLINKICKLSLKAGETNQFKQITGEVVHQIGERFRNLTGPAVQKRKPRKRSESKVVAESIEEKPKEVYVKPADLSVDEFLDRRHSAEPASTQVEPVEEPIAAEERAPVAISAEAVAVTEEAPSVEKDISEEIEIAGHKITVSIPVHVIEQAQSSTPEHGLKVAGALAAQILKKHPELMSSPSIDPIHVWSDIRKLIVARLK